MLADSIEHNIFIGAPFGITMGLFNDHILRAVFNVTFARRDSKKILMELYEVLF